MSTREKRPVAIVTGAGRGIGRATAIELARLGYDLVLTARTAADVDAAAREIGALSVPGDVIDPTHAEKLIRAALQRFGRVDALVNNAGYAPVLTMDQATADEWRRIIETNLTATFLMIKAAWPHFQRQKSGVIVNLSSAASRDPFPGLGLYGAAKAAINVMSLALAREGEPHGIRVHAIAPSATETDMFRSIMSKEQVPTERIMLPADVAKVIARCVTGELAYTSGEVIYLHKTPA